MASGQTILQGWRSLGRWAIWYFVIYLFIVTFAFGEPVLLVIVYASLGALFLPFPAITLLILLNSQRVAPGYRNRLVSNVVLAVSVIPFIVVGVQEVLGSL
jgi:Mn2+/Fe2+ NRAMP family transporter